ncbi:hypothetical protein BH20ACT5_BH20ACT5_09170 [soil metagenome]
MELQKALRLESGADLLDLAAAGPAYAVVDRDSLS